MQQYYNSIVVLTGFALLIMAVCVRGSLSLNHEKKRLFYGLFGMVAAALLCEWATTALADHAADNRVILTLVRVVHLSLVPMPILVVGTIVSGRAAHPAVRIAAAVHVLLQILTGIFGFIWRIDDAGAIVAGPGYFLIYVFTGAAMILSLTQIAATLRSHQNKGLGFISLLLLLIVFGGSIQLTEPTLRVAWPAMALGSMLLCVFSSEMILQRDTLTQLLNRRDFESQLDNITQKVTFFFFDIDHFRDVNETHGHAYGDQCLTEIGALIREVYSLRGKCYRIGGDEFCVITQGHAADAKSLNTIFFDRAGKHRAEDPNFPYLSVGYVYFDPEIHNIQDCMKEASEMMVKYKSRRRANNRASTPNP